MPLHRVANLTALHDDRPTPVQIGEETFVLLRSAERIYAYQGQCPHAGAPLAKGALCNGRLVCPWHKAAFTIAGGELCEPPALESLRRYPVEVRDGQVYLDDQPLPPADRPASPQDNRLFVIIGAGAAGTAAASALRERGFAGRLLLIDPQKSPGYDRTSLSKFVIAGEMAPAEVPMLKAEHFYTEQHIEQMHAEVTRLNPGRQEIELSDGSLHHYDAALLATGAHPKMLDVPGAHLHNVHLLRSRADAADTLQSATPGGHAVIIGDSFIALEAASALRKRGLKVTLIARHQVPFAKQFGTEIGRAIRLLHESNGVVFRVDDEVIRLESEPGGDEEQVRTVRLASGEQLAADLVLVGIGVSPTTGMLEDLSLAKDGAVNVDRHQLAAPGLWAVGDIARFPLADEPTRIEHWRVAQQQARVAAQNMLGAQRSYEGVPFFWTQHFGKRFDYLGHASDWQQTLIEGDLHQLRFIALLCNDGRVAAIVACQQEALMARLAERMRTALPVEEALTLIREHMENDRDGGKA